MTLPAQRAGYLAAPDLLTRRGRMPSVWTTEMLEPGVSAHNAAIGGVACLVCEETLAPMGRGWREAPGEGVTPLGQSLDDDPRTNSQPPHPPASRAPPSPRWGEGTKTILYLHGGGYRMGSPAAWANFASQLAAATGCRVVVPDYRLAPEHPFPAAVQDALAVHRALIESEGVAPMVGGDSAGGGLAAALALACKTLGLECPRKAILLSPWVDLTVTNPTYENRPADRFFPKPSAQEAADLYLQGHDPEDRLASPLKADLADFPPTLILASSDECLIGDALAFQSALADARVPVETHIVPGMTHVWPVIAPALPQSQAALTSIGNFVRAGSGKI